MNKSSDRSIRQESNRKSYIEMRNRYYDKVISMFESGMIAKEIIQTVPVGKSTVYRWFDEYVAGHEGADIRKSPKKAAETIKQLRSRIEQLEAVCSIEDDCVVFSKEDVIIIQKEIKAISVDLMSVANRLDKVAETLSNKL